MRRPASSGSRTEVLLHAVSVSVRLWSRTLVLPVGALVLVVCSGVVLRSQSDPPYKNPSLPVDARVVDLLSRMTLDEKVAQTLAVWQQKRMLVDASSNFDPSKAAAVLKDGIGQITRVSDGIEHGRRLSPRETVEFANAIQKWVIEHTRLGIPVMFHEEALHGFVAPQATHFPVPLGLGATWAVIAFQFRGRWQREIALPDIHAPVFNRWQSFKGLAITAVLVVAFLFFPRLPREWVALVCAGVLLMSRRMASREMMSLVDWQLLVLFVGLFVVNHAFQETGAMDRTIGFIRSLGVDPGRPAALFGLSVVLSNLVSNVPATMLLLPSATHPQAGAILALASTLAGNLFVVGSIANIIVVTSARSFGVSIDFRTHLRTGLPVTLATLILAALWLVVR